MRIIESKKGIFLVIAVVLAIAIAGTLIPKFVVREKESAMEFMQSYFDLLNKVTHSDIYESYTDTEFKKATSLEQYTNFMNAIERKLGKVKKRELINWEIRKEIKGNFFVLIYDASYTDDKATETYTLVKTKSGWKLHRFNINSPALVMK